MATVKCEKIEHTTHWMPKMEFEIFKKFKVFKTFFNKASKLNFSTITMPKMKSPIVSDQNDSTFPYF